MMDNIILKIQAFFGRYKVITLLVSAAVLIIFPLVYHDDYYKGIIVRVLIYVVLASALNVINGLTGQFILGQAGLMLVGSYSAALMATGLNLPFLVCFLSAGIITALFGFIICLPTFKLNGIYLSIVTVGFAEGIRLLALNWNDFTGGPMGVKGIPAPDLFGLKLTSVTSFYYLALVVAVITVFVIKRTLKSRVGRAWLSIKEDQLAASSLGVEVSRYKAISFTMGAFFSGLGGALIAYFYRYISSELFMMDESFNIISMMIVGGSGTIGGPVLGAVVINVLNEFFRIAVSYRVVLSSLVVIGMMWWRPQGLLGLSPDSVSKLRKKSEKLSKS